MKTLQGFRTRDFAAFLTLAAAGALLAPGCGGDDNPEPSTPVITGGTGGSSGGRGGKGNGSSAEGGGANEAGTGEGGENTGTGGKGGSSNSGGRSGKGGSGNEGGEDTGSGATGGTGNTGNTGNEGGEGGGGEDIDCDVRGENNCYRCAPQAISPAPEFPHSENEQFLNHCDDSQGSAFPNAERIPGFTGTLPELP
jgi:hypothetical protein